MSPRRLLALASALVVSVALAAAAPAEAAGASLVPGKPGGVMNVLTREDLAQGFSIHESVTLSTIWPAQPCFNNLVTFDPVKPLETFDTVVPELAEKWSWQDGYKYTCKSARNYTGYCDEEAEKLIERQSQELDVVKRLALVQRIQKKLEDDAARPMLSWRYDDYAHWPHVKNLIPRHNVYNYGRMQEVWLAR